MNTFSANESLKSGHVCLNRHPVLYKAVISSVSMATLSLCIVYGEARDAEE